MPNVRRSQRRVVRIHGISDYLFGISFIGESRHDVVIAVEDSEPVRRQRFNQFIFRLGDSLDALKPFQMLHSDGGEDADFRRCQLTQFSDIAAPIRAHLNDKDFVRRR